MPPLSKAKAPSGLEQLLKLLEYRLNIFVHLPYSPSTTPLPAKQFGRFKTKGGHWTPREKNELSQQFIEKLLVLMAGRGKTVPRGSQEDQ